MTPKESRIIPVIIDTDLGFDDINAILYLLNHPDISIKAISVSCGLTEVEIGTRNLLRLLDHLGRRDIPVITGAKTPLSTNHTFPREWRERSNKFYNLNLPETDLKPAESEILVKEIKAETENITIIALGPLTNIAKLFQEEPSIKEKIAIIYIMGGAVNIPGNVGNEYPEIPNYKAEWNIYIDPHAADIILTSGILITLIPLNATNDVPMTEEFKVKLAKMKKTREAEIVSQFMTSGPYFWDELAVVVVTNPSVVSMEDHHIEVITEEGNSSGETVSKPGKINAQVAVKADAQAFEIQFIKTINRPVD
jgi:inosine-uridine nucleoside N-ribohydrolase